MFLWAPPPLTASGRLGIFFRTPLALSAAYGLLLGGLTALTGWARSLRFSKAVSGG
jgi:hypothetical protein